MNSEGFFLRIKKYIARLNIARKIGYGYSLAIGIAVLGTSIGLMVGDYYQKEAQAQLKTIQNKYGLLKELESGIWQVQFHPQQLASVVGQPVWFKYETSKLTAKREQLQQVIYALNNTLEQGEIKLVEERKTIKYVLQDYGKALNLYTQGLKNLWQEVDRVNWQPEELAIAKQRVLAANTEKKAIEIRVRFEKLSESLNQLIGAVEKQQIKANDKLFHAEILRLQIIFSVMMLSLAIAAALAFYTSRAIARPLKTVTEVAQQVTAESNFDLQATVSTSDEVGLLALSLNQLIQWVGEYTRELKLARQAEEKRTAELTQVLEDLQETQAQLIQTEKMSSLGQMVAGIAHEINNPVNFIYGNVTPLKEYTKSLFDLLDLYQKIYPDLHPEIEALMVEVDIAYLTYDLPKIISSIKMGTERIKSIVLSLKNFSRLDESDIKAADLHEGIDSTLLILNHRIQKEVEIIQAYGDLPLVECHQAQINQVFMNIISNAIDAMLESDTQPKKIAIKTEKVAENRVMVRIRDNGPGIPAEVREKIFDPFFTTKPVGKGTGLGLSICYKIIEKHGGKIEVMSQPERGTEFAIALPVHYGLTIPSTIDQQA